MTVLKRVLVSSANKQKRYKQGLIANTTIWEDFVISSVSFRDLVKRTQVHYEAHTQVLVPTDEYEVISQFPELFKHFHSFLTSLTPTSSHPHQAATEECVYMKTEAPLFSAKLRTNSRPIQKGGAHALKLFRISRQTQGI